MSTHEPLQITALLASGYCSRYPTALDAVLADAWARSQRWPPASVEERQVPPDALPLAWHQLGFHRASVAHYLVQAYQRRNFARRELGLRECSLLTSKATVSTAGRYKGYWVPTRRVHPAGNILRWWAVGDMEGIAALLVGVFGVGAKAGSGTGWVARWEIEAVPEDWSYLRQGEDGEHIPTRPIPLELAAGWRTMRHCRRTYPYYRRDGVELLAVPPAPEFAGEEW